MESVNERTKIWKWLKSQMELVRDKDLKNAMLAEFRKRAERDWGYNPDNGLLVSGKEVDLDDWEKEFVKDIEKSKIYEIDMREEKREQTKKEAKARMKDFIYKGGNLYDIPMEIQTETIKKLYYECLFEYGDEIMEDADRFIKK